MPTETNVTPTLFNMTPRCFECNDLGLTLPDNGLPSVCWRIQAGAVHNEANAAAKMIEQALRQLSIEKVFIDRHLFDVAATLAHYTSEMPCKKERAIELHFNYTAAALRVFHQSIETLRKVWLLPVASRKEPPSGYWIATTSEEFEDYYERSKSAPITQLTTMHRLAKRNFPIFAEQMELDIFNNIEQQQPEHSAAAA